MIPHITIIMPTYNGELHIREAIDSLTKQTIGFENIEVIIIDHHSTDNTKNIINELQNKYSNINSIYLSKNKTHTPGYPRNLAIENAKAEYIMFMDQDDLYKETMCERLYTEIKKKNYDFVACNYELLINNKEYQESRNFLKQNKNIEKITSLKEYPEIIYTAANMTIWNKIFNINFIKGNKIRFFNYELLDDIDFMLKTFTKSYDNFLLLLNYTGYIHRIRRNKDKSTSNTPSKENLLNLINGLIKINNYSNKYNIKCKPLINEILVQWIQLFFKNDLNFSEQKKILELAKELYPNYRLNSRLVNISIPLNIFINMFVKIFILNTNFSIYLVKIYNALNFNWIVNKIFYD